MHRNAPSRECQPGNGSQFSEEELTEFTFPKSNKAPALPPRGHFPQALLYVTLLPNPAGLSVHSDQGLSRSATLEGQ